MFPDDVLKLAQTIIDEATTRGLMVALAESCTGGLVASCLTSIPGSSAVVDRGFVTYGNPAKERMLGIPVAVIDAEGAVSERVARAMAEGAVTNSLAQVSVAVTGIAGPGGGTAGKPVGLVHFAASNAWGTIHERHLFGDIGRDAVRMSSVRVALVLLLAGIVQP